VVDAIAPQPADRFLEIGPGPGVLTTRLAARAAHVTAIEIDRDLAADLRQQAPPSVEIVTADVLAVDLAAYVGEAPLRVAGNLPYNISSPILFKLLAAERGGRPIFLDATLMLQREVADRLTARPGTKDYGVLTICTAVHADVVRVLTLPPGAFRPAPKVHSAVVRLTFIPRRVPAALDATFVRMVRVMFMQRRKTVGNALRPFAGETATNAIEALEVAAIDPGLRPENLDLAALTRLAAAFAGLKPKV
jgi:16S rRNA (adenine1518-N6/adenine1519-N6)-dimethyltransferase